MNDLTGGPVALVTGCPGGIGRATAVLPAEQGWRVFASARHPETLSDLAGESITPVRLDVTDEAGMAAAVGQVLEQAGRAGALASNAGYGQGGPLEEATPQEIRHQFETNTFGPLRLAQLVLPAMRAQGSGRIVNVSSINGRVAIPFTGLYCASKFALEALSDALRMETRPFGVHVIVAEPGSTKTNFQQTSARSSRRSAADTSSPYHRYFEPFSRLIERTRMEFPARDGRQRHRPRPDRGPAACPLPRHAPGPAHAGVRAAAGGQAAGCPLEPPARAARTTRKHSPARKPGYWCEEADSWLTSSSPRQCLTGGTVRWHWWSFVA